MEPTDLTIEILKDIRAEMRSTREELSATREELSERIDGTNKRLDVFAEGQLRLRTEVIEIISAVQQLTSVLREDRQLRRQVYDHERRLGSLEHRTGEAPRASLTAWRCVDRPNHHCFSQQRSGEPSAG